MLLSTSIQKNLLNPKKLKKSCCKNPLSSLCGILLKSSCEIPKTLCLEFLLKQCFKNPELFEGQIPQTFVLKFPLKSHFQIYQKSLFGIPPKMLLSNFPKVFDWIPPPWNHAMKFPKNLRVPSPLKSCSQNPKYYSIEFPSKIMLYKSSKVFVWKPPKICRKNPQNHLVEFPPPTML